MTEAIFPTFFMAGFECSTKRFKGGRRLDLIAATGHDRLAHADYLQVRSHGLRTSSVARQKTERES